MMNHNYWSQGCSSLSTSALLWSVSLPFLIELWHYHFSQLEMVSCSKETGQQTGCVSGRKGRKHNNSCESRGNPGHMNIFCQKSRIYFGRHHSEPFSSNGFSLKGRASFLAQKGRGCLYCLGGERQWCRVASTRGLNRDIICNQREGYVWISVECNRNVTAHEATSSTCGSWSISQGVAVDGCSSTARAGWNNTTLLPR